MNAKNAEMINKKMIKAEVIIMLVIKPLILVCQAAFWVLCSYKASSDKMNLLYPFDESHKTEIATMINVVAPPALDQTSENAGMTLSIPGTNCPKIITFITNSNSW
ncbi:Uncharacterised protein, partial [Metamycoplasma alkalescens]